MKWKLTIAGMVLIVAIVGALLARNAHPVLWRVPFSINQLSGEDHNYVLFNPFRDRSPERAAAAYLEAMRRGSCKDAETFTANIVLPNRFTCEQMQNEYRNLRNLFVQRLRDRRKDDNDVVLYYSNTGYEGNWVAMRQPGGELGDWRVVEFNLPSAHYKDLGVRIASLRSWTPRLSSVYASLGPLRSNASLEAEWIATPFS